MTRTRAAENDASFRDTARVLRITRCLVGWEATGCQMMKSLGTPEITPDLKRTIVDGVMKEAANRPVEQLAKEENALLVRLINLRTKGGRES